MESVAAHSVFLVIFIRKSVHETLGGHRLVESRIEHSHLRHIRHQSRDSLDTRHIGRIVERGYIVAFADFCFHILVDQHTFAELLATMYNAVPYGIDFIESGDAARFGIRKIVKNGTYRSLVVDMAEFRNLLAAVGDA